MSNFFDDPVGNLLQAHVQIETAKVGQRLNATAPAQAAGSAAVPYPSDVQAKSQNYTSTGSSNNKLLIAGVVVLVVVGAVAYTMKKKG